MTESERTPDGRHIVVNGRRWRASDPAIPEPLRKELVAELMAARRAVKDADGDRTLRAARARVADAKLALGERGEPWWDQASAGGLRKRLAAAIRALLRKRDADSSICPSDAARIAGGEDWRDTITAAREVAFSLAERDEVEVLSGGRPVGPEDHSGPLRIRHGEDFPACPPARGTADELCRQRVTRIAHAAHRDSWSSI